MRLALTMLFCLVSLEGVFASALGAAWEPLQNPPPWGFREAHTLALQDSLYYISAEGVWKSVNGTDWESLGVQDDLRLVAPGREVFKERMWIVGGLLNGDLFDDKRDVWSSTDGVDWTLEGRVETNLYVYGFDLVAHKNLIWALGNFPTGVGMYSDDGKTWILHFEEMPFGQFRYVRFISFKEHLYAIGGWQTEGVYLDKIWRTLDGFVWEEIASVPPFLPRSSVRPVVFQDRLFVLGGRKGIEKFNDVWVSDDGVGWSLVTEHAAWSPRFPHAVAEFGGRMWVFGEFPATRDIWSSVDGASWRQESRTIPWQARSGLGGAAFQDRMWITGGSNTEHLNQVWSSADGLSWKKQTDAAWEARRGHTSLAHEGRLYVLGGESEGGYRNDVWASEDGELWQAMTHDAAWRPRAFHASVVHAGKLWVLGGGTSEFILNDVWHSADGAHWELVTMEPPWQARQGLHAAVHRGRIWVVGGQRPDLSGSYGDLWSSVDGVQWRQEELLVPYAYARQSAGLVSHAGRLWYYGGYCCPASGGGEHFPNDVWSSWDGVTWSAAGEALPWAGRRSFAALAHDERLWLIGGATATGDTNEVWVSAGELGEHSGDADADFSFDLGELLRMIQLFNSSGYQCNTAGEDSFGLGPGDTGCTAHALDFGPQDWQLSLEEILRAVQIFNSNGYGRCDDSEDGFCVW